MSKRTDSRRTDSKNDDQLPNWPLPISGGKYVRILDTHVRALRESSPHGNRLLFLDDVVIAHLLAFFNPTLRSLRTIEDFSQTRQAQKHLSVRRLCKSTLSDFQRVADPTLLEPIIARLQSVAAAQGGRGVPADWGRCWPSTVRSFRWPPTWPGRFNIAVPTDARGPAFGLTCI